MRTSHRVASVAAVALAALLAGAGIAAAGDKDGHDLDACVVGPEQALINAPILNCADILDDNDVLNDVVDIDDSFNRLDYVLDAAE